MAENNPMLKGIESLFGNNADKFEKEKSFGKKLYKTAWAVEILAASLGLPHFPTPCRRITPLAADMSILSSNDNLSPRELACLWTLSPSTAPFNKASSSASHKDSATLACSLHPQLLMWFPLHTAPQLVLLLVTSSPTQSDSVKTTRPIEDSWNS